MDLELITKWCPGCEDDRPISVFYIAKCKPDGLSDHCAYHQRLAKKQSRERRRIVFINAMGGECVQCGFSDWRALQVDHVNGGGTAERKIFPSTSKVFYAKVLANRDDYQLLCSNHNTIKRYEENEAKGPLTIVQQSPVERLGHVRSPGKPKRGRPVGFKHTTSSLEAMSRAKIGKDVGRRRVYHEDGSYHYVRRPDSAVG